MEKREIERIGRIWRKERCMRIEIWRKGIWKNERFMRTEM